MPPVRPGLPAALRPRRDLGRSLARLLCALFAFVGAIPLALGALTRWQPVQAWAARETARVLNDEVGLSATYKVGISLWPLSLELRDVTLDSSDGGAPALVTPRVAIKPRLFSLLAGRVDAGQIAVEEPHLRVVIRDGEIANLKLRPPPASTGGNGKLPLASLAITDAHVNAEIEGVKITSDAIDLDVLAEAPQVFEVALRAATTSVTQQRQLAHSASGPAVSVDEDVLCQLDARVRLERGQILVRRLSLLGSVDRSPAPGTSPRCEIDEIRNDPGRVLMRLSGLRIEQPESDQRQVGGHVLLQAPLEVMSRYLPNSSLVGWVQVNGELDVSPRHRFPEFHGKLRTGPIGLEHYQFVTHSDAELHLIGDKLLVSSFRAGFADGDVTLEDVSLDLSSPGLPLHIRHTLAIGLTFPGLMRDLDVTPNTIVNWDLSRVAIDDFQGSIVPPALEGKLSAETRNFEVFDRSVHDSARRHMIGVPHALVTGAFGVHSDSVRFENMHLEFGKSSVRTNVRIGYDNSIALAVPEGSTIELADASPLVDVPIAGQTHLDLQMNGKMSDPLLTGSLGISDLWFAGFPIGDLTTSSLRFVPLKVDLESARLTKGSSEYDLDQARLDFDTDATLVVSSAIRSPHFDLRDFFEMWHFDTDPRWDGVSGAGKVKGRVRYTLGGKSDPCEGGNLQVRGDLEFSPLSLFDERYTSASSSFDFNWFDIGAGDLGMRLIVPSAVLRKGPGSILGSGRISAGGRVTGQVIATQVPISEVQGLGALAHQAVGTVNAEADVSGSLDALATRAQVRISPLRIGRSELPSSNLSVALVPIAQPPATRLGTTACGAPIQAGFDRSEYDADRPAGVFQTTGSLFGGQVVLDHFELTRQREKHVRGRVAFKDLDLVALSSLAPAASALDPSFTGRLDGTLELQELDMDTPLLATGTFEVSRLALKLGTTFVAAEGTTRLRLGGGTLEVPGLTLRAKTASGQSAGFKLGGKLTELGTRAKADLRLSLEPTALEGFATLIPGAERARGVLGGQLAVTGALDAPVVRGGLELTNGAIQLRSSPQSLSELDVKLGVMPGELIIEQGAFSYGGGRVQFRGNAPLNGLHLGELRTFITARNVALPLAPGVHANVDADLRARWAPGGTTGDAQKQALPQLIGNVTLNSFAYSRPVKMAVNITDLAQRGRRTEFDSYQPEGDLVSFDLNVRSPKPLTLDNNLIDASLTIEDDVLQLAGTNQRFGIRGALRIAPGGHVRLTRNEFEIQQGRVRFDDPTRIAPLVDVTAVTEFRRYGVTTDVNAAPTQNGASASSSDWRVSMHAHGDAETLRIDLTSQPPLSQDDIFLLLTLGLTRAELDQLQSTSVGESVALEALGTLTGADQVVTDAIPVIDEFRLGSYASRTGRTEPSITIGKRLSERIRAFVTSGLSESRDVRSNVEVKINSKVSIEGSYDNINDDSSSTLGNLGADLRWRLDFQ